MKSDIDNFKWLFQIEDDGGIRGKNTCVQLIVINNELSNCSTPALFRLVLGKEIQKILVTSSQLYLVFWSIYSIQETEEKNTFTFIVDCGWR